MQPRRSRRYPANFYKAYLCILPFLVIFLFFALYPILSTAQLSFSRYDGFSVPEFIGLENFRRLLSDPYFYRAMRNTWLIWTVNFIPQIGLGLLLAYLFSFLHVRGMRIFRAVYYFPNLVMLSTVAMIAFAALDREYGLLNLLLKRLGLIDEGIYWLRSVVASRSAISLIYWWLWFGHTTIVCMAGMLAISPTYFEAARIDGASPSCIFFRIVLPMLKPVLLFVLVSSLSGGMQMFDMPQILFEGGYGPEDSTVTMALYMYKQAFSSQNYGYGSAVAWGIFFNSTVVALLLSKLFRPDHRAI